MRNKIFEYNEPGPNWEPKTVRLRGEDILSFYYDWWSEQMDKKYGIGRDRTHDINNCIEDFCVVHWAWEVKDETD